MTTKNRAAVSLGRKGGKVTSEAKARAARENGRKARSRYCGPCDKWVPASQKECATCGADTEPRER